MKRPAPSQLPAPTPYLPIAVYGTLRRGMGLSRRWEWAEWFTEDCSIPNVGLYDCGPFPYGVYQPGSTSVGQLLWLDADAFPLVIADLDIIEGVACEHYARHRWAVTVGDATQEAWVYLTHSSLMSDIITLPAVADNDWCIHQSIRSERA